MDQIKIKKLLLINKKGIVTAEEKGISKDCCTYQERKNILAE